MIDNTTSEQHAAEWFFKELRHTAATRRSINLRAAEFYALTTEEGADCLRKFWNN